MKDNTEIETLFDEMPAETSTQPVTLESTTTTEPQPTSTQPENAGTVIGQIQNDSVVATNAPIPENNETPVLGKPIMVETAQPNKKVKKKMNKNTLIIIIALAVVILVCGGYWVYNNLLNKPVILTLRNLTLELGEKVPTEINKYVDKMEGKESDYSLNLSSIVEDEVGVYNYTVTYKRQSKTGTVTIEDTTIPKLTLKDVTVKIGDEVKIEDFIEACEDESNCTYAFEDEIDTKMTENTGTYDLRIIAKDESGNETTQVAKLIVTEEGASGGNSAVSTDSLEFTAKTVKHATLKAPFIYHYKLTFDENKKLTEATLDIDLEFDTIADYTTVKNFTQDDWKKYMPTGSVTKQDETSKLITYHVNKIDLAYLKAVLQDQNLTDDYDMIEKSFTARGYRKVTTATPQP